MRGSEPNCRTLWGHRVWLKCLGLILQMAQDSGPQPRVVLLPREHWARTGDIFKFFLVLTAAVISGWRRGCSSGPAQDAPE